MAGMYPENEEVTIFGEKVQWPGVDKNGKFTNGSFSNPLEKPSFIPAGTINLILDNLSALITKLGGTPDNTSITQLAELFTSAPQVNTGIMRDAAGRAKVAAPVAEDDIARKAETDAEAKARLQAVNSLSQAIETEAHSRAEGDNAALESLASHAGNKGNPHGVTAAQVGLGNVNDTPDNEKSVKYAQTAGSAKADGGNADTVGGFMAGNGVNMLVPVVAFNAGENAGYIKLGNGLIVQWGTTVPSHGEWATTIFPLSFATTKYAIVATKDNNTGGGSSDYDIRYFNKQKSRVDWYTMREAWFSWIAIGI